MLTIFIQLLKNPVIGSREKQPDTMFMKSLLAFMEDYTYSIN